MDACYTAVILIKQSNLWFSTQASVLHLLPYQDNQSDRDCYQQQKVRSLHFFFC